MADRSPSSSPCVRPLTRGLYALADADACEKRGVSVEDTARAMLDAGVSGLQIRAKDRAASLFFAWVEVVLAHRGAGPSAIFVNDRADVAFLTGADGVHVGQDDLDPGLVHAHFPRLCVGWSTHETAQLQNGLRSPAHYLAYGPVFSTTSKRNPEASVGLEGLRRAGRACAAAQRTLVAIGGVAERDIPVVAPHCDCVAAISALLPELGGVRPYSRIRATCESFQRKIRSHDRADISP